MQPSPTQTPAGKAFGPSELSGKLNRFLEVPPGRTGVVIFTDGKTQILPPGKHRILTWGERVAGKGAGMIAGYVPSEPCPFQLQARYFFSGDGELLDAWLQAQAEITDPVRFFKGFVLPQGVLESNVLDLSSEDTQTALGTIARRYAAADLTAGLAERQIRGALDGLLTGILEGLGLRLLNLQAMSFWRSEERAELAEKIQALEERLQDVELQKRMAAVETQAQFDEFVQQVAPEFGEANRLRVMVEDAPKADGKKSQPVGAKVTGWTRALKNESAAPSRWRLSNLFGKQADSQSSLPERPRRAWWFSGSLWIAFLIISGAMVTQVSLDMGKDISKEFMFAWITSVWMIILPLLFDAVRRMVDKREKIAEQRWRYGSIAHIDNLTGRDRARADRLVRGQVGGDIKAGAGMLDDLVSRSFKSGNQELALKIRALRQKFEDAIEKVNQSSFGAPPYLSDLNIPKRGWELMLDYDEQVLAESNAVADLAQQLQETYSAGNDPAAGLAELESRLDALLYHFGGRERAVKQTQLNASGG